MIVQYWSTQMDSLKLDIAELSYEALTFLIVSVYPQVSDLTRLSSDKFQFLATGMWLCYFGTNELRSVSIFTRQGGISCVVRV